MAVGWVGVNKHNCTGFRSTPLGATDAFVSDKIVFVFLALPEFKLWWCWVCSPNQIENKIHTDRTHTRYFSIIIYYNNSFANMF